MIITWILYGLLVSVLLAVAAAGLEALFRLAGAPIRWLWTAALLLTVGLIALAPLRRPASAPLTGVKVIESPALSRDPVELPATGFAAMLAATRADALVRVRAALGEAGRRAPERAGSYLLLLWGAATLSAFAAIGATHHRFTRRRRRWPTAELQGLRVRVAPEVGPVVMGVKRPEIVVPRWFLELDPAQSRLVLTHESEHVRARDPLLLAMAWTIAALLAWNPAVWWMVSRLRLAVELDCDARVLRRGESPHSYGAVLIDLAGRSSPLPVGMLALADPPSQLERRLLAMTHRRTRSALARGCALGAFALAALTAACAAELPTAAEIQAIDVAAAEQAGNRIALLDDGNTVYKLDGVIVTREQALALAPENIARVGVVKARTPGGPAEIAIVSRMAGETFATVVDTVSVGSGTGVRIRGVAPVGAGEGAVRVRGVDPQGPEPIYLVDGVRQAKAPMGDISPGTIESIHVIKDRDAAVKLAGPDAANGLVVIRTKGGKPDGLNLDAVPVQATRRISGVATVAPMRVRSDAAPSTGGSGVLLRGVTPGGPEPLYIVDGVQRTSSPLSELDPATIESVSVLKDKSATDAYGARGVNGVVIITTKKPTP